MKYFSYKTLIILSFLLLGGGFALFYGLPPFSSSLVFEKTTQAVVHNAAGNTAAQDTDGDGLKDWEESLWNTDIQNPDTDGDGTQDGDEVRAGRDPAKAAPDDIISAQTNQSGNIPQKYSSDNLTERFAESFQPVYDTLNSTGDIDPSEQDALGKWLTPLMSPRSMVESKKRRLTTTHLYFLRV